MVALGGLLALGASGCGQEIKRENEQLKARVATLQEDNTRLKAVAAQVTDLKAQIEGISKELEGLRNEKADLEEKLKAAEAKAAARAPAKKK